MRLPIPRPAPVTKIFLFLNSPVDFGTLKSVFRLGKPGPDSRVNQSAESCSAGREMRCSAVELRKCVKHGVCAILAYGSVLAISFSHKPNY